MIRHGVRDRRTLSTFWARDRALQVLQRIRPNAFRASAKTLNAPDAGASLVQPASYFYSSSSSFILSSLFLSIRVSSSNGGHTFLVDRPWRIFESFRTGQGRDSAFASWHLHRTDQRILHGDYFRYVSVSDFTRSSPETMLLNENICIFFCISVFILSLINSISCSTTYNIKYTISNKAIKLIKFERISNTQHAKLAPTTLLKLFNTCQYQILVPSKIVLKRRISKATLFRFIKTTKSHHLNSGKKFPCQGTIYG